MNNNYIKYFERKALAEKIFDNNGKLTIEKRVSDAGRTTYYIVGKQEKLYNAGIYNATEMNDCSFFEKLISKKVAENLVSAGKAEVFDYNTVKKYLQFTLHDLRYFIISYYPTKTKSIQTRTRAASDLTDIKEELDKDNDFNVLHTYNENFRTPNNPWGRVPTLGGRIIDIYGGTVAYFDACGEFMSPLFQIEDDKEYSQTFEYDCWVSPAAMDVATEAEEQAAKIPTVTELGYLIVDKEIEKHFEVNVPFAKFRVEGMTYNYEEHRLMLKVEYTDNYLPAVDTITWMNNFAFVYAIITDTSTGKIIWKGGSYGKRTLEYIWQNIPTDKTDTTSTAISELVTLIADAGYTVPETIINVADKQATLEHLTIIAEAAGVIEPLELCK